RRRAVPRLVCGSFPSAARLRFQTKENRGGRSSSWVVQRQVSPRCRGTSLTHGDLGNLERIQLLDIVRRGGDLIRQIRRGPRKRVSIPVRLYLESSSQTCAEETLVREVSQHGAALTSNFQIIVGELVKMERMDTGERVECIVRWRERR